MAVSNSLRPASCKKPYRKAKYKPCENHIMITCEPYENHTKATCKPHENHAKATCKPYANQTKITPIPTQMSHKKTMETFRNTTRNIGTPPQQILGKNLANKPHRRTPPA